MLTFRPANTDEFEQIESLVRTLPQWFTSGGLDSIKKDFNFQKTIVARLDQALVGFITYYVNQGKGNISWMAVSPQMHRKGIGRSLVAAMIREMRKWNVKEVFVSTLGDSVDYPPYANTREFYRRIGFHDFKVLKHPENPECEEELILRRETEAEGSSWSSSFLTAKSKLR
jgi:N-acetylglutamate synthase-like GNAT family acetyltransferase